MMYQCPLIQIGCSAVVPYNCGVDEQCWVCMVRWSLNYVVNFYCCWTWHMWAVFYAEDCGVSNAEYLVHSVHMNRWSVCREFCGAHCWQNRTRCRDGVKVLWCHSHLVFDSSIPTCACFHSENFLVTCFFLGMVRQKRGGRGGWGEDAWSIQ